MYRKIMVPLDGSELAECVLPHVSALMRGFRGSKAILVRVVDSDETLAQIAAFAELHTKVREYEENRKATAEAYLRRASKRLDHAENTVEVAVLAGRVSESLVEFAETIHADVIVIATHGRSGVKRWIMGSVADKLVRSAHVPILMVRAFGAK